MTLQGPADANNYRVKVGRFGDRWYTDPLPACPIAPASDWQGPSFSIVKKAAGGDWSYVSMKRCARDITARPAAYSGLGEEAIYEAFKNANKLGLGVDAGRGTIIHWWLEDGLAGRPFRTVTDLDLQAARIPRESLEIATLYLPAIGAFFDAYQPELVAAETVCIHRDLNDVGYGATGDVIMRIEGETVQGDWKSRGVTSDHGCYPEEACQVAAGAFAQYVIVDNDGSAVRAAPPAVDRGLIVSVKHDGVRLYPVELDPAWRHWEALHAWWVARRDEKKAIGKPWAPKAATAEPEPANLDRDSLVGRVKALVDAGHGERLTKRWPAGVPGFKTDHDHSVDERRQILVAVQQLEDETSAPFHPDDATPPPTPAERPAKPPRVDNGGWVDDLHQQALKQRYDALPADDRQRIEALGVAVGVNEHRNRGDGRYTRRHWSIVRALVLWSEVGWDDDVIRDLAASCLDNEAARQPAVTLAAVLARLAIEQADRLADMSRQISAGSHRLDATPGHWQLLPAA